MHNKILFLGDMHLGARSDNINFKNYLRRYFNEVLFPLIKEEKIETIVQVGDIFDRRKYINFHTLYEAYEVFFDFLEKNEIKLITILGNHDVYHKNTLKINAPELLLRGKYNNIQIINTPTELEIEGRKFLLVPWICQENTQAVHDAIETSSAQFLVGHFEFQGFEMQRGVVCDSGTNPDIASKFDMVISGHFHHKSHIGDVLYIGIPYEITWNDFNDQKGVFLLDQTNNLEFVPNHMSLFYKIDYNDKDWDVEFINNFNYSLYKGCYVKLVVKDKT